MSTLFSYFCPIYRTLSGATTPGQSESGSDSNEGVLRITQGSSITGASLSDWLMSYQDIRWVGRGSYPSAKKWSVYFTAPVNWAIRVFTGYLMPKPFFVE